MSEKYAVFLLELAAPETYSISYTARFLLALAYLKAGEVFKTESRERVQGFGSTWKAYSADELRSTIEKCA
jgi:uncharacterized membrane protein YecN with MAPEG domain